MGDSFPRNLRPMMATLSELPPDPDQYGFEFKWDGYRALAYWDGRAMRFESRNGNDLSGDFPELQQLKKQLGRRRAVLDGEIIAVGDMRRSFSLLQQRMGLQERTGAPLPVAYLIFDVLFLKDRLVTGRSYVDRRAILEDLKLSGDAWRTPAYIAGQGSALLQTAREQGLEGVVAKRLDSVYRPGERPGDWLKIKIVQRQEFVIGGWVEGSGALRGTLGALLVGYFEKGEFRYAGKVGTGFSMDDRANLVDKLRTLAAARSPFSERISERGVHFVRPRLVGEVAFTEWTHLNKFRHPSFKGLRADKKPSDVRAERIAGGST